jgi:5-hydroxyisourate hydrolase-like protein (transthyretin family)
MPGTYSSSISNPLSEYQIVFPILTDENGEVVFTDLKFSQEGRAGSYQLRFECLSYFADSAVINVKTSVASIDFFQEPLSYMNLLEFSIENKLNPII